MGLCYYNKINKKNQSNFDIFYDNFFFDNNIEFPITVRELNVIAISAVTGCNNPKNAAGIATQL
jgi:hypothetical protein